MRYIPLLALPLLAGGAAAQGPVVDVDGWARPTVPAQTGSAAYLTIRNLRPSADRLLSVSTSAAARASVHSTSTVGGVVRMRSAGPVQVGANQTLQMRPGGLHIMLIGLKQPLRAGQRLPLTLRFQRAGLVRTSVPIRMEASSGGHRH